MQQADGDFVRILLLFGAAGLLALRASANADRARCSMSDLAACQDTNELVWSAGFKAAIASFLGNRRTEYLRHGGRLTQEAIDVLGGPPDDRIDLRDRFLFTACRSHSCTEKGAAVLRRDGQIDAVAIVWYPCSRNKENCSDDATLSIFMRDPADTSLIERLKTWITREFAKTQAGTLPVERLGSVRIYRRPNPIRQARGLL
jgi:hypothetical protein